MYDLSGRVRVVKPGTCTVDPGRAVSPLFIRLKHQLGIGGGSTVTLVRGGDDLLLVDTGYEREADGSPANDEANWRSLCLHLGLAGVRPEDVTRVFITHPHRDHTGGLERFPRATWHCLRSALEGLHGPLWERFIPLDEGDEIVPGAVVLHTAGHTRGHGSLLWSAQSVRIAVAGDAVINLAWLQAGYIWRFNGDFYDAEAARQSAARLLAAADIIIPGHGEPFFAQPARAAIARQGR